jgi:hypothetical protein
MRANNGRAAIGMVLAAGATLLASACDREERALGTTRPTEGPRVDARVATVNALGRIVACRSSDLCKATP